MDSSTTRKPHERYSGTNGFTNPKILTNQPFSQLYPSVQQSDPQKHYKERRLRDAVELHRKAENMLEVKGTYFPGLDALEEELKKPETSDDIKDRLKDLQKEHEDEMARLLDRQVEDYFYYMQDAYLSKDDGIHVAEIEEFYDNLKKPHSSVLSSMNAEYSEYRYAFLRTFNALSVRRMELRAREELVRKQRDALFPKSIAEYHAINSRDIQIRVARFLLSERGTQERMLSEFGWAWRQVTPLVEEYTSNVAFQAEIQALSRDVETRDPRKRPS